MSNGSNLQNKSAYELEKIRLRFAGQEGQTRASAHSFSNDWIPKANGTYAFPKHVKGNEDGEDTNEN